MPKPITKSAITTTICCLAYTMLTACGTKGPLYIPEQRYPQKVEDQKDSGQEAPKAKPQTSPETSSQTKTPTY